MAFSKHTGDLPSEQRKAAFSLIEVVIATAVFATTIVAIMALMAPLNRATTHVLEAEVAGRLVETIEGELARLGFQVIAGAIAPDDPLFLYATADGSRVLRGPDVSNEATPSPFAVDNNLLDDDPPGIAQRDRYFLITVRQATLNFDTDASSTLPLSAQITWPYRLPTGPATSTSSPQNDPSTLVDDTLRQSFTTFFAVQR